MAKKNKKDNIFKQIDSQEKYLDERNVESYAHLEVPKGTKVTRSNVFELLSKYQDKKNIILPSKIKRILKRAAKYKRKADGHENDKNNEDTLIEVKNISKYYLSGNIATRVLDNVSMQVKKGELLLIYGVSGGGKSTLLNLVSGLDRPNKGQVIVCNNNLPYLSDRQLTLFRRKHVSFIFQNYNLLENLNAYDNVETGAYLQKDEKRKVDIAKLFEKFNMLDEITKYPSQMSGGQQQRVSIMRALAKNAEIIFADEPTGALDEETTKIVLRILYNINKETDTTVVMVSHNPQMAVMADRVVHVVKGHIEKITVNKNPISPDSFELYANEKAQS